MAPAALAVVDALSPVLDATKQEDRVSTLHYVLCLARPHVARVFEESAGFCEKGNLTA